MVSVASKLPKVRAEANKALVPDPRNVEALVYLGNADTTEGKKAEAETYFQRALALDPSNANAHLDYGNVLPMKQTLAQKQEAVQLDPDSAPAQNNLAVAELDMGEYAQALIPARALIRLDPTSADSAMGLALIYSLLHRNAEAVKAFDLVQPKTELAKALVAAGQLTYQSLLEPKLNAHTITVTRGPLRYGKASPLSFSSGASESGQLPQSHACASRHDLVIEFRALPSTGWT